MPISANSDEYKSVIGLDEIYVAEVTEDSASAYTAGTPEVLAPAADIAMTPVSSQSMQYADNQPFDVFEAEAETNMDITLTGVPSEMLAKLLGSQFDAVSGRVFDNMGIPPFMALGFRTMKSDGSYKYYWFQKVQFIPPAEGAATKADKITPQPIKLVCKALKTIHKWDLGDVTDGVKRVYGDEDTTNFSATTWFSQVQTPSSSAPSGLALSSSDPADNATSVATSKIITLTFNNALPAGEIYHVVVTKADGTLKATTNTLDATKKIMTVTPGTALSGSTVYIVSIGVTDIYGQNLASIVNFTTA
jgi:phi13 family phage major tail protein